MLPLRIPTSTQSTIVVVVPIRCFLPQTLPVKSFKLNIAKKEVEFFETSFKPYGLSCMSNPAFLNNVIDFGKFGKDKINEETIEFLVPYLEIEGFNPQVREREPTIPFRPPNMFI